MKRIILLSLVLFHQFAYSQIGKNEYLDAKKTYDSGNYSYSLQQLNKVQSMLGSTNAVIEYLRVKCYYDMNKFDEASNALIMFYKYPASSELITEMEQYKSKIRQSKLKIPLNTTKQKQNEIIALYDMQISNINVKINLIDKDIYTYKIEALNGMLIKEEFTEASMLYNMVSSNKFYSSSDIPKVELLKEYIVFKQTETSNNPDQYLAFLYKYPNGKWSPLSKEFLYSKLESLGDKAHAGEDFEKTFYYYNSYLSFYPTDERNEAIKQKINNVHASKQKKILDDGDMAFRSKQYGKAQSYYKQYLSEYPNGTYSKEVQKNQIKCDLYTHTSNGFFWTLDHKKAIGFSYDLIADKSIGAGFGMKFNPFFIFGNHDKHDTQESIPSGAYIRTGDELDIKYIFSIHLDLSKKIVPRFWLYTGIGFGYYDFYNEVDMYESYELEYDQYSNYIPGSGHYVNYKGSTFLREENDRAGWKPYFRLGGYYLIKSNLSIKYGVGFKNGLTHEIGISFAQPW